MNSEMCAACDNIHLLGQKADLISRLEKHSYSDKPGGVKADAVGAHVRHILDHYFCFITGLPDGRIDYDLRQRDMRIVEDPVYAVERIQEISRDLERIIPQDKDRPLQVKIDCGGVSEWSVSSVARELQFLLSHHVHHNALIRMILECEGVCVDGDFGVAPSTIKHLQKAN